MLGGIFPCSIIVITALVRPSVVPYTPRLTYFLDLGKVFAGIQVPHSDADEFNNFLQNLGYHYVEETDNPVVKKYLRS